MGTIARDSGDFTPAPAGTHLAICVGVTDLGTQHNEAFSYEGKSIPASDKPQILVTFELVTELIDMDGEMKPMTISKFFNLFLNEKASLRKDLESWRSRQFTQEELQGFDVQKVLGAPCMVGITHTDRGKAKITSISAVVKGMVVPEHVHPLIGFSLDDYNQETFDQISEGIQKIIAKSPEYQALMNPSGFRTQATGSGGEPDFTDDDIPF